MLCFLSKEVRKIFEQLQNRTSKMQITQAAIDNVRKIKLDGFDKEESEKIYILHKELLRYSMKNNDSNEVGMLVSLIGWKFLAKTPLFDKYKALVYYDEVYDLTEEGSVKEFLRSCKRAGLDYNYGGG